MNKTSKIRRFGLNNVFRPDWPADDLIFVDFQSLKSFAKYSVNPNTWSIIHKMCVVLAQLH